MSGILATATRGKVAARPVRALLYGVEGVGKSTWAAGAPAPVFLDAERGTLGLDVVRVPIVRWPDFFRAVDELRRSKHDFQTVVLDTLDALDRLLVAQVCADAQVGSIEDVGGGFGKGWTQVEERWGRALEDLAALQAERRMNVVALAHAHVETHRDPTGADWQRWALRMPRKSAAVWKGWTEELLFATRDVSSGRKDKGKGKGGERVLYTKWAPGRDAKNRRDLPERLPLTWPAFSSAMRSGAERTAPRPDEEDESAEEAPQEERAPQKPAEQEATATVIVNGHHVAGPAPSGPPPGVEAEDLRDQIRAALPRLPDNVRPSVLKAVDKAGDDLAKLRNGLDYVRRLLAGAEAQKAGA